MRFDEFFTCLAGSPRGSRVETSALLKLVNHHHAEVGRVSFRYFDDFPGAQMGMFIWLDEDRSSPYDEPYRDAIVFINNRYREDRPMRRLIGAKELMHVFDTDVQRTNDPEKYARLLQEIESRPEAVDMSEQYLAEGGALWKATLALVPPWIRSSYKAEWDLGNVKAAELAARLWLPEAAVTAAMTPYYEAQLRKYVPDWKE